ncbi:hypothetical protein BC938DRAFT_483405 [Jimgerdemannia flammicorona]|uniref:Uncharacterized protein n=1 Tax=Jimgerdemannia flammicorona TaxID=994334 RepID=A0A433QC19_9FUNG|nr:hypothetical protein BC938DRAFT_483405 [Jimgerdemannia flammicorona]
MSIVLLLVFASHPLSQLKNTEYKVQSYFSNTDAHVLSGSEDDGVYVWDLVEGTHLTTLRTHMGVVSSIDYHPSDAAFVSGGVDGFVNVWGSKEAMEGGSMHATG